MLPSICPRLARAKPRAAARARGLRVVLEETASGRGSVRPGLVRVLGAAQRGAIDVALVQRLDRRGRSTLDLLANLRRLRSAGIAFVLSRHLLTHCENVALSPNIVDNWTEQRRTSIVAEFSKTVAAVNDVHLLPNQPRDCVLDFFSV